VKYESFIDPSGGSNDSMTCAIGHLEGEHLAVVDCLREVTAPFDPESTVDEFVQLLSRYGLSKTNGDRYAARWVATAFEKRGVDYRHCELPRSQLYLNLLPHLNSRTVRLLDHLRAVNQIASLERRTARGARDTIDHPRDQHDDVANAIAGLVFVSAQRPKVPQLRIGSWATGAQVVWADGESSAEALARANVAAGSAPSTIRAGSDLPSDELVARLRREANYRARIASKR
jgi:hypothetical protein